MTYFGFLVRFLILPSVVLGLLILWEQQRGKTLPAALRGGSPIGILVTLIIIAVVYTTPWDNYLVATGVWGYDPTLVTGVILGWVPLEEYLFFVLQPVLIGLWLLWLAPRLTPTGQGTSVPLRVVSLLLVGVWIGALVILLAGWQPGTYLGLELVWALPPILMQLGFGLDILMCHRRLILLTIIPATLYLSLADSFALASGIWMIHPAQSLGIGLGPHLPIEEFVFFLLTTTLVTFGLVLGMATESWDRIRPRMMTDHT
ncbi:MAG: lycopene cyclase domain-containing protein [Caldilinea sp. CFX5]|nr:lycopene cyclase domain-containing protein [Caldilinea sp. CFX5]